MMKIPNWIIITIVLGILIGSKFIFFSKNDSKTASANKPKNNMPIAANYYVVNATDLVNDVFATGKIGAFNQIDILPEVNGKVTAIYFKEGETVTKGSLLLKLNDADLQAQLLKSKTQQKLSEQKLERVKKLLQINGVSQEEVDVQENEINAIKADQAFIAAQIAKTNILAPFTGVIGLKNISEGAFVNSTSPIASLVQIHPLYVEFSIPEKYSNLFHKNLNIKFLSDNTGEVKTYTASIYAIEPKIDETTKTIKARAKYEGNQFFYPGSFVKVTVDLKENKNALMIPTQAVIPTLKGQKVILYKSGIAIETMINTGVRTDTKIQVISGLQEGDTIITTGLMMVRKDSKLKLIKETN